MGVYGNGWWECGLAYAHTTIYIGLIGERDKREERKRAKKGKQINPTSHITRMAETCDRGTREGQT